MKVFYGFLNTLLHVIHGAIVTFALLGWILPVTRPFHLAEMLIMLSSWYILGIWKGQGYCFLTDWHWKIKRSLGEGKPEGTYIHLLAQRLTGKTLDSQRIDRIVVAVTILIAILSLLLNLKDHFSA